MRSKQLLRLILVVALILCNFAVSAATVDVTTSPSAQKQHQNSTKPTMAPSAPHNNTEAPVAPAYPTPTPSRPETKVPSKAPVKEPTVAPTKNATISPQMPTSPPAKPTKTPTAPTPTPHREPTEAPITPPVHPPTQKPVAVPTPSPTHAKVPTPPPTGGGGGNRKHNPVVKAFTLIFLISLVSYGVYQGYLNRSTLVFVAGRTSSNCMYRIRRFIGQTRMRGNASDAASLNEIIFEDTTQTDLSARLLPLRNDNAS